MDIVRLQANKNKNKKRIEIYNNVHYNFRGAHQVKAMG